MSHTGWAWLGVVAQRRGMPAHDQQVVRGGVGAEPEQWFSKTLLWRRGGVVGQHGGGIELGVPAGVGAPACCACSHFAYAARVCG